MTITEAQPTTQLNKSTDSFSDEEYEELKAEEEQTDATCKQENAETEQPSGNNDETKPAGKKPFECIKFPDIPDGHKTYFNLCKDVLKKRTDYAEANVMLRLSLQKFSEMLISSEKFAETEFARAKEFYDSAKKNLEEMKSKLAECQGKLDGLVLEVSRIAPIQGSKSHPSSYTISSSQGDLLVELSAARASVVSAKQMHKVARDKFDIAKARYNAAKTRYESDKAIAKMRAEIDLNISAEYN